MYIYIYKENHVWLEILRVDFHQQIRLFSLSLFTLLEELNLYSIEELFTFLVTF